MFTDKGQKRQALLLDSGLNDPRQTDIVIVIMGQTKSGKTTLVNSLVEDRKQHKAVGHLMVSETSKTSVVVIDRAPSQYADVNRLLGNRRIVLVDTPGFNDTTMNDAVVLTSISQWLVASYGEGMCVGGILHLRDITQSGWNGIESRDFKVFSKICGDDGMNQVSLVTTKWGKLAQLEDGTTRVDELLSEHWKSAINQGASVFHLRPLGTNCNLDLVGTIDSPWQTVQKIVTSMDALAVANRILHIQDELVNKKYFLSECDAGKEVCATLANLLKQAKERQRAAREDGQSPAARDNLEKRREEIVKLAQQLDDLAPAFIQRAKRWWTRDLMSLFRNSPKDK